VLKDGAAVFNENGSSGVSGPTTLEGNAVFNVANAGANPALTISGDIAGPGSLTKIGTGPLVLNGQFNDYSGATLVSNGTLVVNGGLVGTGPVTVHGGTLAGSGTVAGNVTIGPNGNLAPGDALTPISLDRNRGFGLPGRHLHH
jgi:fibronectin-binding autotransporter adhesin